MSAQKAFRASSSVQMGQRPSMLYSLGWPQVWRPAFQRARVTAAAAQTLTSAVHKPSPQEQTYTPKTAATPTPCMLTSSRHQTRSNVRNLTHLPTFRRSLYTTRSPIPNPRTACQAPHRQAGPRLWQSLRAGLLKNRHPQHRKNGSPPHQPSARAQFVRCFTGCCHPVVATPAQCMCTHALLVRGLKPARANQPSACEKTDLQS